MEQRYSLVRQMMWEQFQEALLLDHELFLEKVQERKQLKKGRNRKFEGKREVENKSDYHKIHDRASEKIGTKTMED